MKTFRPAQLACSVAVAWLALTGAAAATDVGVSVQISQPGVYGRVDIGRFPQPQLVVAQPIVIARPVVVYQAPPPQPVYMWVPPGHRQNWRKHCGQYRACGVPVYFVQDQWYDEKVRGHGKEKHKNKHQENGRGHGQGKGQRKHDD